MKVFFLTFLELAFFSILPLSGSPSADTDTASASKDSLTFIEKVYLHVDRDSYYPGDDIWFKAYLVEAVDRFLTNHSMNLHVELISPTLQVLDNRIVRLVNGLGHGDFHLSEKLPSGRYRIRAYTNYMRNFGDQMFFSKDINIINSSYEVKAPGDTLSYSNTKPEITFFPEGGSLVDSVTSVVAFKAVDQDGFAVDVSGKIYSTTGLPVTDFSSTHGGMGIFMLHPIPGLSYYAVIKNNYGDELKYEIPEIFNTGIVLNVASNKDSKLNIIFSTNARTLQATAGHDLMLTISARGNPFKSYYFRMNSLNSKLNLPTDDLPDGIVMLTLTGTDDVPFCERLVYIHNGDDARVSIKTDKEEYIQRDSVDVKISLTVDSKVPQDAFLSLSATDNIFTEATSDYPTTISSWFLLESDVHGLVEEPGYYFDSENTNRLKDLDILLLTQGWRDFKWKYDGLKYPPEYGFSISGRVRKKFADIPLINENVTIGIFGEGKPVMRIMQTDSSGRFLLSDLDITGKRKIIASVTNEKDQLRGWLILDSSIYYPPIISWSGIQEKSPGSFHSLSGDSISANISSFIQHSEYLTSLKKKYRLSDTITPGEVTITARREESSKAARILSERSLRTMFPDKEYVISKESEIYSTVGMVLRMKFHIQGIDEPIKFKADSLARGMIGDSPLAPGKPIVMLNGMEVGFEGVSYLPVTWVERIDYLSPRNAILIWGYARGQGGVLSVILKSDYSGDFDKKVYHSVNTGIHGFNEPRIFYSPKHNTSLKKDYKPDLRSTLFWEPDIKIENNNNISFVFYNADNSATVRITVEGITDKGIPVTGTKEYKVR